MSKIIELYKNEIRMAEKSWNPFFISQIPKYKRKIALELALKKDNKKTIKKLSPKNKVKQTKEKKIFLATERPTKWQFCASISENEVTEKILEREVEFWFDLYRDK